MDVHRNDQAIPVYIRFQRFPDPHSDAAFEEQVAKLEGQPSMVLSRSPL
jgi:hypothetical protein